VNSASLNVVSCSQSGMTNTWCSNGAWGGYIRSAAQSAGVLAERVWTGDARALGPDILLTMTPTLQREQNDIVYSGREKNVAWVLQLCAFMSGAGCQRMGSVAGCIRAHCFV